MPANTYGECDVEGCGKTRQHSSGKYCAMHLARWRRNGTLLTQKEMGVKYNPKLGTLSTLQLKYIEENADKLIDREIAAHFGVPEYKVRYARRKVVGRKYKGFNKRTYLKLQYRNMRGNRCEICGWNQAPCDVHHRVRLSRGGTDSFENYICLCPNHHRILHYSDFSP